MTPRFRSLKRLQGRGLPGWALVAVCFVWLALQPVQAVAAGWSAGVDLPVQFVFTGDFAGTTPAKGVKLTLDTPINVGLGYERYSVNLEDKATGIDTSARYTLIDVFAEAYFRVIHIAFGYGKGKVSVEPFTSSGTSLQADDGDASQYYLQLGWPVNNNWAFHVAHHRVDADTSVSIAGVPTAQKLDLSGIMHSVGIKYMF